MKAIALFRWKNSRFFYHAEHVLGILVPRLFCRLRLNSILRGTDPRQAPLLYDRLAYYNKIQAPFQPDTNSRPFRLDFHDGKTNYYLDLLGYARYFNPDFRLSFRFGDVTQIPEIPALVKSRPIEGDNRNSVLFNLNKIRHFIFVEDSLRFEDKIDKVVWRGRAFQEHRKEFLRKFYDHKQCDVGHYHKKHQDVPWVKPHLRIKDQLRYKFVLAIEGNDVASNLKWIMYSNSLCFMTKPRYETWFMEGRLIPGQHYVLLRDDYSDLAEKIDYYSAHTAEALEIIHRANQWVDQFRNRKTERIVSLLVLWKYFHDSGQIAEPPPGLPA